MTEIQIYTAALFVVAFISFVIIAIELFKEES